MLNRRTALKRATGALAFGAVAQLVRSTPAEEPSGSYKVQQGRIKQSVVWWCFKPMTVVELAEQAAGMGLKSVELIGPEHWAMLKEKGLICAMTPSHGFAKGFAHKEEHVECLKILRQRIDESAQAGFPNVITFSGFRRGVSD